MKLKRKKAPDHEGFKAKREFGIWSSASIQKKIFLLYTFIVYLLRVIVNKIRSTNLESLKLGICKYQIKDHNIHYYR